MLESFVIKIHRFLLLLLSLFLLLLFLGSGHDLSINDSSQLKLLIEILLFFGAGIGLFFKRRNNAHVKIIILLILVQICFIDFFIDISSVEYGEDRPTLILILLTVIFFSNLFIIYSFLNTKRHS